MEIHYSMVKHILVMFKEGRVRTMITVCKMKMDATFEVWCLDNKNEIC